jgi:hypothetical protein
LWPPIIEQVLEPDDLLSYLLAVNPRYIVISTPDRNLLRAGTHNGPPRNPSHVREWNFAKFEAIVASRFQILEHFSSSSTQRTLRTSLTAQARLGLVVSFLPESGDRPLPLIDLPPLAL